MSTVFGVKKGGNTIRDAPPPNCPAQSMVMFREFNERRNGIKEGQTEIITPGKAFGVVGKGDRVHQLCTPQSTFKSLMGSFGINSHVPEIAMDRGQLPFLRRGGWQENAHRGLDSHGKAPSRSPPMAQHFHRDGLLHVESNAAIAGSATTHCGQGNVQRGNQQMRGILVGTSVL